MKTLKYYVAYSVNIIALTNDKQELEMTNCDFTTTCKSAPFDIDIIRDVLSAHDTLKLEGVTGFTQVESAKDTHCFLITLTNHHRAFITFEVNHIAPLTNIIDIIYHDESMQHNLGYESKQKALNYLSTKMIDDTMKEAVLTTLELDLKGNVCSEVITNFNNII